ncbi:MAG: tetratricopeptide repeat protein [Chloroflexi bacterium]|nr:tetratricopeptide repeat protein [Chloroflexota bacterium]
MQELLAEAGAAYNALHLDEALIKYRAAAEADPQNAEAQLGLARTLTRMRRQEEAFAAARRTIELQPERYEGYAALGVLHFLLDENEKAVEALRQAIERAPDEPEPHLTLAQVHADAARFEEADRELERARELIAQIQDETKRKQFEALAWHAETYRHLSAGNTVDATAAAQRVVATEEANPYAACLALSNLGILEARARHYDQAIEYLERAFEMNPYFYRAGSALGRLLIIRGKHERAAQVLAETIARMPDEDAAAHYAYALALSRMGQRQKALEEYQRALALGLSGADALLARWQTIWLSEWGRYGIIGLALAVVLAWIILSKPTPQMLTLVGLVIVIFILQRTLGRRRR